MVSHLREMKRAVLWSVVSHEAGELLQWLFTCYLSLFLCWPVLKCHIFDLFCNMVLGWFIWGRPYIFKSHLIINIPPNTRSHQSNNTDPRSQFSFNVVNYVCVCVCVWEQWSVCLCGHLSGQCVKMIESEPEGVMGVCVCVCVSPHSLSDGDHTAQIHTPASLPSLCSYGRSHSSPSIMSPAISSCNIHTVLYSTELPHTAEPTLWGFPAMHAVLVWLFCLCVCCVTLSVIALILLYILSWIIFLQDFSSLLA